MKNNDSLINEIIFEPNSDIEIYYPEEKVQYRLKIADTTLQNDDRFIAVLLPKELESTFYKGEDFIQCKYVHDNVLYQFGGEIIKIVYDNVSHVLIKKPINFTKGNLRTKNRVPTKILSEYFVEKVVPGADLTKMQGFATIKDVSMGGVSFITNNVIPFKTVIKLSSVKPKFNVLVEITTVQRINEKYFYGGKITGFEGNDEIVFKSYIEKLLNNTYLDDDFYSAY